MRRNNMIYFATSNEDKVNDFRLVFDQLGIELARIEKSYPVQEDGKTLLKNARIKALTHSSHYPTRVIMATDGGVRIPYLGERWNHVLTRRLTGIDRESRFSDSERAETLLDMMSGAVRDEERRVFWEEAVVLAYNRKAIFEFTGTSDPGILGNEMPDDFKETGFWVGYLWFDPELGKTYMQMTQEEMMRQSTIKNSLVTKLKSFDFMHYGIF